MKIYLIRHGEAPFTHPDKDRDLNSIGIEEIKALGKWLSLEKIKKINIIHSPLKRIKQTIFHLTPFIVDSLINKNESINILPESDPEFMENFIRYELEEQFGTTLIISHMPYLSNLLFNLTGVERSFKTSECIRIEKRSDDFTFIKSSLD